MQEEENSIYCYYLFSESDLSKITVTQTLMSFVLWLALQVLDSIPIATCTIDQQTMKAAQFVYGDEVVGVIVLEEEGDLLTQLARDVLEGAKLSDLQSLFSDDLRVNHNPMGNLIFQSAVIIPGPKVKTWDDWVSQKIEVVRRTRRKEVAPEGQIGLGVCSETKYRGRLPPSLVVFLHLNKIMLFRKFL